MRKVLWFMAWAALVAGCRPAQHPAASLHIAALLKTSTNPYFQLMWEGIKQEADLHGLSVDLYWPTNEADFQYQYDFLQHHATQYDVILLSPSNVEGIAPYLPPLKRAGKKIVVLDADIQLPAGQDARSYYDTFLGTDNELGGMMVARFAGPKLPAGSSVIIMGGFPLYMHTPGRVRAFREALQAQDATVKITEFTANYDRVTAQHVTEDHWATFAKANLVFCANDHMALGVLDALQQRPLVPQPLVTGYDSIREAQEHIMRGTLLTSVIQFPARMGREGVKAIVALARGDSVERQILIDPELSVRRITIDSVRVEHLYSHSN